MTTLAEQRIKFQNVPPHKEEPGLLPKGSKVLVHMGGGKVEHGEYIRKARSENQHHVKVGGQLHSVDQEDIGHGGKWMWKSK